MTASQTQCEDNCAASVERITTAFAEASIQLEQVASAAQAVSQSRAQLSDTDALAGLLGSIATYLESDAWYTDLSLTQAGMDGEEVAARVVGTLAVWRNVEPFVGLMSQEIDTAVNTTTNNLLRDVRRNTRGREVLTPDSPEIQTIRSAALTAALDFRRAAGLFVGG